MSLQDLLNLSAPEKKDSIGPVGVVKKEREREGEREREREREREEREREIYQTI